MVCFADTKSKHGRNLVWSLDYQLLSISNRIIQAHRYPRNITKKSLNVRYRNINERILFLYRVSAGPRSPIFR